MKAIIKKLTNNLGLKILSVIFAAVLWLVVVNIDEPQRTTKFNIPITIENESYLTNLGKYYELADDMNTVTISVTGDRTTVDKLAASDFKAVANIENIENFSQVKIEVSAIRYTSHLSITQMADYLTVTVGDLATRQFIISAKTTGTPAEGTAVGSVSLNRNLLKVSGPEDIVSRIDSAVALVNVDGLSTEITDEVIPELYDVDGNRISAESLKMNVQTVEVMVSMLEVKEVPLSFQTSGEVGEGYEYVGVQYSPQTVRVKGSATVLNTINSITIPGNVLDLTGATEKIEKTVDISYYLPDNVSLVDMNDAKVKVKVNIDEKESRTYYMPVANITVQNLPENYNIAYSSDGIKLSISGFSSALEAIDGNALTGTIDVAGLTVGTNSVPLQIQARENCTIAPVNVVVYLTEKIEDTTQKDNDDSKGDNTDDKKSDGDKVNGDAGQEEPDSNKPDSNKPEDKTSDTSGEDDKQVKSDDEDSSSNADRTDEGKSNDSEESADN